MHEGKSREQWNQTSALMCLIANTNRDPKKRPRAFKPSDFNPWFRVRFMSDLEDRPKVKIQALKVFLNRKA